MSHSLFIIIIIIICFFINKILTENSQCLLLNNKLNKYGISINNNQEKDVHGLKLCRGLIKNSCCPQIYEDKIQNATTIELYQLFEFYSMNLYEPLLRLSNELNDTIIKIIESSRNETHFILQHGYKNSYNSYRLSIDLFYNKLLKISYKNYSNEIKNSIEEFFQNILQITIDFNPKNQFISSSCLWKNHPFGNRPNLIGKILEINLGKLLHLNELLKLNIELIQIITTSVTTDYQCIDSYMQLSYCNLCSGQKELPCLSNCINIMENCLVNVTLINNIWRNFLDSLENVEYFNDIEKILSSIGISISDALMTFFNSDGIQNKDIIDQCGNIYIRKEIFDNDQKFHNEYRNSFLLSLLDKQILSIKQSLEIYRSFWLILPKQICKSNEISAVDEEICWTGNTISRDLKQIISINYDKPLSLRLQWILKEIKEKSQLINHIKQITTTTTSGNLFLINQLNLTKIDLDDYPNDKEFDYSDYAYEDSKEEFISSSTTTTIQSSTILFHNDDGLMDDRNTVSYYDYGEQDVYTDEELIETTTEQLSSTTTTTTEVVRIPSYHQRQPVIWNIHIDDEDDIVQLKYNSSYSLNYSFLLLLLLLLLLLIFILT